MLTVNAASMFAYVVNIRLLASQPFHIEALHLSFFTFKLKLDFKPTIRWKLLRFFLSFTFNDRFLTGLTILWIFFLKCRSPNVWEVHEQIGTKIWKLIEVKNWKGCGVYVGFRDSCFRKQIKSIRCKKRLEIGWGQMVGNRLLKLLLKIKFNSMLLVWRIFMTRWLFFNFTILLSRNLHFVCWTWSHLI